MTLGMLSSTLFGDMFGTAAMRAAFGELALIARCAEVEAALACAQARLGIVPEEAASAIAAAVSSVAADPASLDLARLKRETETVGYPILPLVRQLAERAGAAGRWLHWGATTQDIMDTAAVLQIRDGLALIETDLAALRGHLAALARRYATPRWPGARTCSTPCRSPSATRPRCGLPPLTAMMPGSNS
jgi:3-carboxy-cis,cis-muconate cycloisomerase